MRCYCCNRNLSDYESTIKSVNTGNFLDMCMKCIQDMDIEYVGNNKNDNDLIDDFDIVEEDDGDFIEEDE